MTSRQPAGDAAEGQPKLPGRSGDIFIGTGQTEAIAARTSLANQLADTALAIVAEGTLLDVRIEAAATR
jgi:hypothetical protein